MSDFSADFNIGNTPAPEPEQPAAAPQTTQTLTAEQEYAKYPLSDTEKQQVEEFAKKSICMTARRCCSTRRGRKSRSRIFRSRHWKM